MAKTFGIYFAGKTSFSLKRTQKPLEGKQKEFVFTIFLQFLCFKA